MKILEIFKKQKSAYRIVTDEFKGFEVQYRPEGIAKKWKMPNTNTHASIEEAKEYIAKHKMKIAKEKAVGQVIHFEEVTE